MGLYGDNYSPIMLISYFIKCEIFNTYLKFKFDISISELLKKINFVTPSILYIFACKLKKYNKVVKIYYIIIKLILLMC